MDAMTGRIATGERAARTGLWSARQRHRQHLPADDCAERVIADDGEGFMPTGHDAGMGSRRVRAFARQPGNDYAYARDNGLRFAIRFPARRGAPET